jgi:pimeloyl-ACP methyl ester carboxylesterase
MSRALFDIYQAARSAARPRDGDRRGPEFTADYSPGGRPVAVVLLPALFVGDWLWDPLWSLLTTADWPAVRFREAASLVDRHTARSIGRLSDALARACRQHTAAPLVLCGDSLGALIALEFGRRYPGDVLGMAVSGAPGLDHAAALLGREVVSGARDPREIADRFLARLLYEPERLAIDPQRYAELIDELATPASAASMLAGLQAIRGCDVRRLLPGVVMPKLFVWGRQDQITPVEPWRHVIRELPNARLVELDNCGHAPMFERPDDFHRELSQLLCECVDGMTTR